MRSAIILLLSLAAAIALSAAPRSARAEESPTPAAFAPETEAPAAEVPEAEAPEAVARPAEAQELEAPPAEAPEAAPEPTAEVAPEPPTAWPEPAARPETEVSAPGATVTVSQLRPLRPRRWHLRIAGEASPSFFRDPSLDPLKSNDLVVLGGLTLGGEWIFLGVLPLVVDVAYQGGRFEDSLFDEFSTETELHSLQLGAQLGYRLWDALTVFARLGLALSWTHLIVGGQQAALDDWAFSPGFYATAGFELSLPRRWMRRAFPRSQVTLGLRFEAGYLDLGRFDFPGALDETSLVPHQSAALGTTRLAGATIRTGFFLSF